MASSDNSLSFDFQGLRQDPILQCDLVMKGGITSGVVYPRAIIQLATKYRLTCLGGTSAGAIAAGLAAAAEHGRSKDGFQVLDSVAKELPKILTNLFQATPKLRPLLDAALIIIKKGSFWRTRLLLSIATGYFRSSLSGLVLGGALGAGIGLAVRSFSHSWGSVVILTLVGAIGGMVALLAMRLGKGVTRDLSEARFGMCPGKKQRGYKDDALLDWLERRLREAAGLIEDRPLTFGDLSEKGITLQVLTTSLAEGRPYRLPFDNKLFFFKKADFYEIFPGDVVDFMLKKNKERESKPPKDDVFARFPEAQDLPVIVAIRMSLSFPVLLQAVPLYSQDFTYKKQADQEKFRECVFSDGGISSNLPIHFFDSPLPSRPTFAMNLENFDPLRHDESERVELPLEAIKGQRGALNAIEGMGDFMAGIMNAMQNWQDTLRLTQPGTRERVASIRLDKSQGGLNLEMKKSDVEKLIGWGNDAGKRINDSFQFNDHRWRRHLVWWGSLEAGYDNILPKYDPDLAPTGTVPPLINGGESYKEFLDGHEPTEYKVSDKWMRETNERVARLMQTYSEFDEEGLKKFADTNLPKPKQTISVVPDH